MIKLRYKIVSVLLVLVGVFLYGRCGGPKQKSPTIQPVLPSNDTEQIRVNPETHQLIIVTSKGTQTVTLPDRTSTIDVLKNGTVTVTSPQFGFEHHLFVGLVGSEHVRFGAGMDGLYFKKLDLGIGVADQIGVARPIAFAKLSYNIKGNIQAGIVYQSNQYVGGIVSVRLF